MKNTRRISVRFDLDDPEQRRVFDALHSIARGTEKSMNAILIKAAAEYLDRLERPFPCGFTLDELRTLFREELQELELAPREPAVTVKPPSEMTEKERAENDRNVLESLALFM